MTQNLLAKNDSIGVIATSSPAKADRFAAGCAVLEAQGFKLEVIGQPCVAYGTNEFLFASAPAHVRAANLMQLYVNKEIKAVIAARGAGGVIELLPLLNPQIFKDNPKPFIGFSDSTALLVALQSWGCPVVHGPHVESFTMAASEPETEQSAKTLTKLLLNGDSLVSAPLEPVLNPGDFSGVLTGGNLSVLAALCGTHWQLNAQGKILFIEDINENPHRVHRMLVQLRHSGVLAGLAGVCLGEFTKCDATLGKDGVAVGPSLLAVVQDALAPCSVPVYRGLPSGHIKANVALPFFGMAKVIGGKISIAISTTVQ